MVTKSRLKQRGSGSSGGPTMTIGVIGPTPGSKGGIGVMMEYLRDGATQEIQLDFIDSGFEQNRIRGLLGTLKLVLFDARRYDAFHVNVSARGSTFRKILICAAIRSKRKKYLLHLHSGRYEAFVAGSAKPLEWLIKQTFRGATRVVVLGPTWKEFVQRVLGVTSDQIVVIPNAVPGPKVLARSKGPQPVVLFVGKLTRQKGVEDLLAAVDKLANTVDWKLVLAGDGADETIQREIDSRTSVAQLGWLSRSELRDQFRAASIFVLPSYSEGLPLALLEAMAWGVAPVISCVGSVPEVIVDGVNGVLVTPGDVEELASRLNHLVSHPSEAQRLGDRARHDWEESYDSATYASRLEFEYRQLSSS